MPSSEAMKLMKRMRLKYGLSPTLQAYFGSIMVGHRVKPPNGFHLLWSTQYFILVVRRNIILNKSSLITPFPERFQLQLNRRWTGTLNKSTVDRGV